MGVNIFSPSFILQVEKKEVIMTLPPTKWVKKLRNVFANVPQWIDPTE